MPARADGACIHLTPENLCDIYETRPEDCRIDGLYERLYRHVTDKDTYYRECARACNWLMDQQGIDPLYRINLKEMK